MGEGRQKSVYSTGQYIRKPLPLQPNSLSSSFTASYLDCMRHKGNWRCIVRADINPWYFHCSPLKSSFPSLLLGNSHRARGHANHGEILRFSDKDRKKEKKHKLQQQLVPFFVFTFVLSSFQSQKFLTAEGCSKAGFNQIQTSMATYLRPSYSHSHS